MWVENAFLEEYGNNREYKKNNIVGKHTFPIVDNGKMQSLWKEKIGFPERSDEKYADDFTQEDTNNTE